VPQPRQLSIHDPLQSHQGAGGGGAGAHLIYLSKWADLPPNGQICLSEMIHCWPCCSGSEHVAARLLLLLPASSAADGAEARVPCVLLCGAVLCRACRPTRGCWTLPACSRRWTGRCRWVVVAAGCVCAVATAGRWPAGCCLP
jgi:hypothetical protein